ncbi:MAG: TatD family hydrolase [Syntrophobacteraceae bacterium]
MVVDTHAHLDFPELGSDLDGVLDRASRADVRRIVTIGIDIETSRKAIALAHAHEQIYATVGLHPHGAKELPEEAMADLKALASQERVVAIGEVGLDYYRDRQPRPIQRECFEQQLELACEVGLPVVFHIREAHEDFLGIVQGFVGRLRGGILHCFSGDWTVAGRCLDLGFFLSIPGTVTYSKAQAQQDVVRKAPMDRLLVETDAPFLAPVPFRGKDNEPSYVIYTVQKIAQLRNCPYEEVAMRTSENAALAFGLDLPRS